VVCCGGRIAGGGQAIEGDADEPVDRRAGPQAGGRAQRVQAELSQLVCVDIAADPAGLHCFGEQLTDEMEQLALRMLHVVSAVQLGGQRGVPGVTGQQGVGLQDGPQSVLRLGMVPDLGQMREVLGDLTLVPGEQDGFDVREVLVQGRPGGRYRSSRRSPTW